MPQKLILPINKCHITASYKTPGYKARFGFTHFGVDMVSFAGQSTVYANGNGEVIRTGLDNVLGNVVIARYDDVLNHKTGSSLNVIARYYHLASISVSAGAKINKDTVLGQYGSTGKYSAGAHLHIEFDSDTSAPLASKTLGGNSSIIQAADTDTTIDPGCLLYRKATAPDNQEIKVDAGTHNGQPYAAPEIAKIPLFD